MFLGGARIRGWNALLRQHKETAWKHTLLISPVGRGLFHKPSLEVGRLKFKESHRRRSISSAAFKQYVVKRL